MKKAISTVTEALNGAENGSLTVADVEKKLNEAFSKMTNALDALQTNGVDVSSILKPVINSITSLITALGETKGTRDESTQKSSKTALSQTR